MGQEISYKLVVTGILCRNNTYLIIKRSDKEKKFPGMWTVPGGTVELNDHTAPNADGIMYDILERALSREIKEETGLSFENLRYVVSLAYPKSTDVIMCLSFMMDALPGEVVLDQDHTQYAWVTLQDAKSYTLISGILEELALVEELRASKR